MRARRGRAALHGRGGILHLDVKPDNIIMGVPPRLIDLSIATPLAEAADAARRARDRRLHAARAVRPGGPSGRDLARPPTSGASARRSTTPSRARCRSRGNAAPARATIRWLAGRSSPAHLEPLPRDVPTALRELIARTLAPAAADRPAAGEVALALEPLVAELPRKLAFGRFGMRAR